MHSRESRFQDFLDFQIQTPEFIWQHNSNFKVKKGIFTTFYVEMIALGQRNEKSLHRHSNIFSQNGLL
jgi:hypothetical protein